MPGTDGSGRGAGRRHGPAPRPRVADARPGAWVRRPARGSLPIPTDGGLRVSGR